MWNQLLSWKWPITVIIITFTFFFMFKKAICNFFITISNRINNVYYKGLNKEFNFNLGSASQNIPTNQLEYTNTKHLDLLKAFQSILITTEEITIKNQLSGAKITNEQAINILITHLANANLRISLLAIDRLIFQEQIKLLSYLNTQHKAVPQSDLLPFYKAWLEQTNSKDFSFDNFLGFLTQQGLITLGINGYYIGLLGKEYLSFLVQIGKSI